MCKGLSMTIKTEWSVKTGHNMPVFFIRDSYNKQSILYPNKLQS